MKTKLLLLTTLLSTSFLFSQEVLTFSGYDGNTQTLTANTATVNDNITIVFEDQDIVNDFYTSGQDIIYLFGGLKLATGDEFQGSPGWSEYESQPNFPIIDGDSNTGPNTYSLTLNLSQLYTGVADGETVDGFNLIFHNQWDSGTNNQTANLYIDLVDAVKNSTLSTNEYLQNSVSMNVTNNVIKINGLENGEKFEIKIHDYSGKEIKSFDQNSTLDLNSISSGFYILNFKSDYNSISKKIIIK